MISQPKQVSTLPTSSPTISKDSVEDVEAGDPMPAYQLMEATRLEEGEGSRTHSRDSTAWEESGDGKGEFFIFGTFSNDSLSRFPQLSSS